MNLAATTVDGTSSPAGVWTAAAVARHLGVAPSTLRNWAYRHGIGPPGHQSGRYRRYTDVDVAELATMRRLTEQGMTLPAAAALARSQHRPDAPTGEPVSDTLPIAPSEPAPGPAVRAADVDALVQAAHRLDADALVRTLEVSLARRGVSATWNHLCRPALAGPVDRSTTSTCIDAEILLAWAVTTSLRRLPNPPSPPRGAQWVLLACAPGEHHSLALDALLAALTQQHVPAQLLGPSVPTSALVHAAERTHPAAILVWAQTPRTAHVATLRRLMHHAGTVVAAGPGWTPSQLPAGTWAVTALDDAVRLARHAVDEPAPGGTDFG